MSPQPDARQSLQHERYRSHRAVKALLEHVADTTPLVLMLDDIHWADLATVELLGAMLRRPPAAAVLLALARRPRHVSSPLAVALDRAHRAAALTRIELGPLTSVEARAATERVDALSEEEATRQLNALAHLATADLNLDRFMAATRHARRALEIGRATGQGELLPEVVAMLGGEERSGFRADPWKPRSCLTGPWRPRAWRTTRKAWPGISSITAMLPWSPDMSRSRLPREPTGSGQSRGAHGVMPPKPATAFIDDFGVAAASKPVGNRSQAGPGV